MLFDRLYNRLNNDFEIKNGVLIKYKGNSENVVIPKGVHSIGNYAFYECPSLKNITVDSNNPNFCSDKGVLFNKYKTELILYPAQKLEESYDVPRSVKSILECAFRSCGSLKRINIPDSVTSIGSRAFEDCTSLESIILPNSITSIENELFYGCRSLKNISIPDSVTSIEDCAFGWSALESIVIPQSVKKMSNNVFHTCLKLKSVTLPDSFTTIGDETFCGCGELKNLRLPSKLTSIGKKAFSGCGLVELRIPEGITVIKSSTFVEMTSLEKVYFPASLTEINGDNFNNCPKLREVYFQEGLKIIKGIFNDCPNLEKVTFPKSLIYMGEYSFNNTKIADTPEFKVLKERLNNPNSYPKPYGYQGLDFERLKYEGLKFYYDSKTVDFKNDVRNIVKPDDKSEFKRNDFKLELEITYEKRIFKNKFGKMALALYRSIPTFDSSDREWDSYDELYIMPDGDKLTAFIVGGGHHIGIIYKYTDVLCGNELTENILKSYGIL